MKNNVILHGAVLGLTALASVAACSGGSGSTATSGSSTTSSTSGGSTSSSSGGSSGSNYTAEQLSQARAAIPKLSVLKAPAPDPAMSTSGGQPLLGAMAEYPSLAFPFVAGVNGAVTGLINGLKAVTDLPPTTYNSTTKEFFWGPFPDNDSPHADDNVSVYVREQPAGSDFRFVYALIRGRTNDQANYKVVIWGGANPHATNPDYGSGVTLWDFEANRAWLAAQYPGFNGARDHGRFAAVYIHGPDEQNAQNIVSIVYAVFRNFVPKDNESATPADFDHLYGHVDGTETDFDFVHLDLLADINAENMNMTRESVDLRLAFVNSGIGRGEATVSGGDLNADAGPYVWNGVECWGDAVERTFYEVIATGPGLADGGQVVVNESSPDAGCVGGFQGTLGSLGVPTLANIPTEMRTAVQNVAENGIPAE